jgi:hypothetical protein
VSTKANVVGPCLFIALLAAPILTIATGGTASAADECLAAPEGPAPKGLHWFYRLDQKTRQKCWYLRDPAAKPDSAAKVDPPANADPTPKVVTPVTPNPPPAAEPGALSFGAAPASPPRPATTEPATRGLAPAAAAQPGAAGSADSLPPDSLSQRWSDQTSGIARRDPAPAAAPVAVEPAPSDAETLSIPPPAVAPAAAATARRDDTAGHALAIIGGVALAALSALAAARLLIRQRDVLYRPGLHLQSGPRPGAFRRAALALDQPEPLPREAQGEAAGKVVQARAPEGAPAAESAVPEDLEESLRRVMRALKRAAG